MSTIIFLPRAPYASLQKMEPLFHRYDSSVSAESFNGESNLKFNCESNVAHCLPKPTISSILSCVLVMSVLYYPFYI